MTHNTRDRHGWRASNLGFCAGFMAGVAAPVYFWISASSTLTDRRPLRVIPDQSAEDWRMIRRDYAAVKRKIEREAA